MAGFGMETLWPEDGSDTSVHVDLVFVHGLRGGRQTTWKRETWSTLWPKDLLPQDVEHARVLTVRQSRPSTSNT